MHNINENLIASSPIVIDTDGSSDSTDSRKQNGGSSTLLMCMHAYMWFFIAYLAWKYLAATKRSLIEVTDFATVYNGDWLNDQVALIHFITIVDFPF